MEKQAEIEMLKDFSNANATSGFENEFVDLFSKTVKDYADVEVDGMLNVYASKKENTGKRPVIQLDAHSDAVGFLTQAIRPNGLIKFVTLGGWNNVILPGLKVKVRSRAGEYIPGVIALKPPHFMSEAERNSVPKVADLSIDVGSSSREETIKDYEIDTGCPIFVDAGPARADFPLGKLPGLTVLSPNETETAIFTGIKPETEADCIAAARKLAAMSSAAYIVIKLGGRGAFVWDTAAARGEAIASYKVDVVDTTAAGDAFTAALTLEYLRSGDICRAIRYGNAVGSITVSRAGASTSIPSADEVDAFIAERKIAL